MGARVDGFTGCSVDRLISREKRSRLIAALFLSSLLFVDYLSGFPENVQGGEGVLTFLSVPFLSL